MRAREALPMTSDCTVGSITTTWNKVKKGTSAFAWSLFAVQRLQLTGNPFEEVVILGSLADSKGVDICEAVRLHQARMDGTVAETGKRTYYPMAKYVPCWKVLRNSDNWSGAAGSAAAGIGARSGTEGSGTSEHENPETDDPTDGPRTGGKVVGPVRKLNPCTSGTKAAKRAANETLRRRGKCGTVLKHSRLLQMPRPSGRQLSSLTSQTCAIRKRRSCLCAPKRARC